MATCYRSSTQKRNQTGKHQMKLDHIMYAASDLQEGIDEIEKLTGVQAVFGGAHPGNGTCNALLSLGDAQYFEIIAPDPDQALEGTLGQELFDHQFSGIRTWAVAVEGFGNLKIELERFGYQSHVIEMSRTRPDDVKLSWQILRVSGHPFGLYMPFFIDWLQSPHPADETPRGCTLESFVVQLAENKNLYQQVANAIGLDVEVIDGTDGMRALIESPNGRVLLH